MPLPFVSSSKGVTSADSSALAAMKYDVDSVKESIGRLVSEGFAGRRRTEKIISSGTFYRTIVIVFSLDTEGTGRDSYPRNRRIHATDCLDGQLFTGSTKNSKSIYSFRRNVTVLRHRRIRFPS